MRAEAACLLCVNTGYPGGGHPACNNYLYHRQYLLKFIVPGFAPPLIFFPRIMNANFIYRATKWPILEAGSRFCQFLPDLAWETPGCSNGSENNLAWTLET